MFLSAIIKEREKCSGNWVLYTDEWLFSIEDGRKVAQQVLNLLNSLAYLTSGKVYPYESISKTNHS